MIECWTANGSTERGELPDKEEKNLRISLVGFFYIFIVGTKSSPGLNSKQPCSTVVA